MASPSIQEVTILAKDEFQKPMIKFEEVGYQHLALKWKDEDRWSYPWLIQRSKKPEFQDPIQLKKNQSADNTESATFRWLGINADNYVDLDGLREETQYYYRVAAVTNMSEYLSTGEAPTFTKWKYGTATTKALSAKRKQVFDVTDPKYGAISGDGNNDYQAILNAFKAAQKSRGGIIYLPAGEYDLWPEDKAVKIVDGLPTIRSGDRATSALFNVSRNDITFLGETSNGNPSTFLKLYLWGKEPATKYLNIVSRDGTPQNARRYFLFHLEHAENFTIRNLDIDGGAIPVTTGKSPGAWGLKFKQTEWDESHKLIASFTPRSSKNVVVDNVDARNWRGEVYYNGGGSEKWLIKNGEIRRTNSSAVSGAYDLELVNMVIAEAANACVESAIYSNFRSGFTNRIFNQNHIARDCTFIGLDQSEKGFMKDLPGKKTFSGWHCFNQAGTYQTVTDCIFRDTIETAFGPWHEYRNGFLYNCSFGQVPVTGPGHIFYLNTTGKGAYQLKGGMSDILWMDNELVINKTLPNHQPVMVSYPGPAAKGNQSPWIWEGFHIRNTSSEKVQVRRFWVDSWGLDTGRSQALFKNFTRDETISFDVHYLWNTKPDKKIHPVYESFFQ